MSKRSSRRRRAKAAQGAKQTRKGDCRRRLGGVRAPVAAFTLIELLLVAAILVGLAGAMAPRMSGAYRGLQFKGRVHEITSLINFASETAIRSREEVELRFVEGGGSVWVEKTRIQPGAEPAGAMRQGERAINIHAERQTVEDGQTGVIRFYPDGTRTEELLQVSDGSGRESWIRIGPSFAALNVTDQRPEDVQP